MGIDENECLEAKQAYVNYLYEIKDLPEEDVLDKVSKLRKFYAFCSAYNKNLKEMMEEYCPGLIRPFMKIRVLRLWNNTYWVDKNRLFKFEMFYKHEFPKSGMLNVSKQLKLLQKKIKARANYPEHL